MILDSKTAETAAILDVANKMCAAARTAPKARGIDHIHTCVVTGDDIVLIADEMERLGTLHNVPIFNRDAKNVRASTAMVMVGSAYSRLGMTFCQYCGFESCADCAQKGGTCVYDPVNLGIAAGSAAALAADARIDNRIIYTAGKAVLSLGLMGPEVKIAFGIPLSALGKKIGRAHV